MQFTTSVIGVGVETLRMDQLQVGWGASFMYCDIRDVVDIMMVSAKKKKTRHKTSTARSETSLTTTEPDLNRHVPHQIRFREDTLSV